jgi:squalene monooxygenase
MPNHGHVILADPSPILLYQIGTRDTRILVDIPGTLPSAGSGALKAYMTDFVGPQLPKTIQGPFYDALETDRLRSMPNSWLPPSLNEKPGLMVLGDALNMRHPLTGGGMTVALWDVVHVSKSLSRLGSLESEGVAIARISKEFYWTRKSSSAVINILANALYALFSAGSNTDLILLQSACFGYFRLGGRCASTPVGLLAGLVREPLTLIGHFFAVALYAMVLVLTSGPWYAFPLTLLRAGSVLLTACRVIVPLILAELLG